MRLYRRQHFRLRMRFHVPGYGDPVGAPSTKFHKFKREVMLANSRRTVVQRRSERRRLVNFDKLPRGPGGGMVRGPK